jgi:hypothetical protein
MSTDQATRSAVDATIVVRAGTCAALLGSAAVHATVVSEHYEEWFLAGLFFLGLQVVEVLLALAVVMAWGRRVAALVVLTSLGTLGVWAVSRTVGVPVGPESFQGREAVGVPDLACVVLEVVAAALVLPWALAHRRADGATDGPANRFSLLAAAAAVLLAAGVTGWGLGPALSGEQGHHQGDEHPSAQGHPLGHR